MTAARLSCHWYEDEHGGRYLIPGCHARVEDPAVEVCHCPTLEQQLEAARRQIAGLKRSLRGRQGWHDAIVRAVHDHPAGIAIMKAAADRAERAQDAGRRRGSGRPSDAR